MQRGSGDVCHMLSAHTAVTLHQRKHSLFGRDMVLTVLRLPPNVTLVNLNHLVLPAQWRRRMQRAHTLADAMRHEPSGLIGDPKHAVELVAADAFLARGHEVRG